MKPAVGKTTVSFEKLVDAASEIATAKDNVAEAGNTSICAMSGDKTKAPATGNCGFCGTTSHNAHGFSDDMRKKYCKAYGRMCDKCQKLNHFSTVCKTDRIKKRRDENKRKAAASVKEVSTVDAPAAAVAAPVVAAPGAVLNSVQAVPQTQQPAGYVFNPERFSEIKGDFWQVSTVADLAGQNSMSVGSNKGPIGQFVFDEMSAVWRRKSPTPHAAARVKVELDRSSYLNRTRSKEMRKAIQAWSFPDCGAQVCMIPPAMVAAMGGSGLVMPARPAPSLE